MHYYHCRKSVQELYSSVIENYAFPRLCRIAAALGVPINPLVTDTQLMIEGEFNELVTTQETFWWLHNEISDDSLLYLVSDLGIIKSIEEAPSASDVITESYDTIKSGLRSALCEANQVRGKLEMVIDDKTTKLAELNAMRLWKLRCEMQ